MPPGVGAAPGTASTRPAGDGASYSARPNAPHPMPNEAYSAAARELLATAAQSGIHVLRVGELKRYGARCEPLLGALVGEVQRTSSRELLEELANVLATGWAREAAFGPLLERYRAAPNSPPSTKAMLAQTIGFLADERGAADLIEIASNRRHGNSRAAIVAALGRLDAPGVFEALIDLLRDPGVGGHALVALASVISRNRELIDVALVKPFLADGRAWVRREAKDLLHTLDELA